MLTELQIENFALVERQRLSFGPGLNVISGETGAGKSIVLQAIQFLLGEKLKSSPLRSGAEQAEVQGLFLLGELPKAVFETLPDLARQEELSVVRSINKVGKSRVYINGKLATVGMLEEVMGKLVNICGQHHHVRLLDQRYHLEVLDGFAGNGERVERFRAVFDEWRTASKALLERERMNASREMREELLRESIRELESARLAPGIRADLEQKVKTLANSERIIGITQRLSTLLGEDGGLISQFQLAQQSAQEASSLDAALAPITEHLKGSFTELREFEAGLQRYMSGFSMDESQLNRLRDQLAEVARLERKYRRSDSELIALLDEYRVELSGLADANSTNELKAKVSSLEQEVNALSSALGESRRKAAKKLSQSIERGLKDVAMAGSSFSVTIEPTTMSASGAERVEFLLSPNQGEPARALREIASGGELSRILLVLKQVLSDRTGVNVLVFDEVDSGVSGAVARAVGLKLKALASSSQVICVTHLPQVASLADHHFLVGKRQGARVVTEVEEIKGDQRIDEIARMLAGYTVTAAARESARELMTSKE